MSSFSFCFFQQKLGLSSKESFCFYWVPFCYEIHTSNFSHFKDIVLYFLYIFFKSISWLSSNSTLKVEVFFTEKLKFAFVSTTNDVIKDVCQQPVFLNKLRQMIRWYRWPFQWTSSVDVTGKRTNKSGILSGDGDLQILILDLCMCLHWDYFQWRMIQ